MQIFIVCVMEVDSTELASCVRNHRQLSCHLLAEIMNCSAVTVQCIRAEGPSFMRNLLKLGYYSSMCSHSIFLSAMCVDLLHYYFNACLEFLTY